MPKYEHLMLCCMHDATYSTYYNVANFLKRTPSPFNSSILQHLHWSTMRLPYSSHLLPSTVQKCTSPNIDLQYINIVNNSNISSFFLYLVLLSGSVPSTIHLSL